MNKLCINTSDGKPRKHEQRLLRNMGVHTVVLDLLKIPYDHKEDTRMIVLMRMAHEFLQKFCLGNQQNQARLYFCANFAWFLGQFCLLEICFLSMRLDKCHRPSQIFPVCFTDFAITRVWVSFIKFIFWEK